MTSLKQWLSDKFKDHDDVAGVVLITNPSAFSPVTDGCDHLVLVISRLAGCLDQQVHWLYQNERIQQRHVSAATLEKWVADGLNKEAFYWVIKGEILLDRGDYIEQFRQKLLDFPEQMRQRKLLIEFSKFLRSYLYAREYHQQSDLLDAYNNILEAIHHWARIAIIEAGFHPETTVWGQVKAINTAVYKLYEELTLSKETLKQRVELVLLACEFSVVSKMDHCCKPLLDILASRDDPWSLQELRELPQLSGIGSELSLLLNKLVKKSLAQETFHFLNDEMTEIELRYSL